MKASENSISFISAHNTYLAPANVPAIAISIDAGDRANTTLKFSPEGYLGICDVHEERVINTLRCGGDSSRDFWVITRPPCTKNDFYCETWAFWLHVNSMQIIQKLLEISRQSWPTPSSGDIDFIKQHLQHQAFKSLPGGWLKVPLSNNGCSRTPFVTPTRIQGKEEKSR